MAGRAAYEAQRLPQTFTSLSATANVLLNEERAMHERGRGGWMAYHAGVAAGLVGRPADATAMFGRIADRPAPPGSVLHPAAERMARLATEPFGFRHEVAALVARQRDALGLPALDTSPF